MFDTDKNYVVRASLTRGSEDRVSGGKVFELHPDSIISLNIIESVMTILPKMEMVMTDKGSYIDIYPILDNDILTFIISNGSTELPDIEVQFIVSGFSVESDLVDQQYNSFRVTGYLATTNAFVPFQSRVFTGSSDSVLDDIATEIGMEFNADSSGTESVDWYQYGNNYQFIRHVGVRSYVPNDSVFVYGDTKHRLNYTTIKTKYSKGVKFSATYNRERVQSRNLLEGEEDQMYFDFYDIVNLTDIYNNISNYGGQYSYYDLTEYKSEYIDIDAKITDLSNKSTIYKDNPVFYHSTGVINDTSLVDTIYRGYTNNSMGKYSIFTNTIALNINSSTQVELFDVVDVNIPSTANRGGMAEPYSGDYFVLSISTAITRDTPYAKTVMLGRSGINKPSIDFNSDGVE